jgi:hypothetical protein
LRGSLRGDPDIGWVGTYKARTSDGERIREGNVWTAATFGLFAVRDSAGNPRNADFEYFHVTPKLP